MKLTDEQLDRISEIMDEVEIMTTPGERSWIRALAAGMRELAAIYYSQYSDDTPCCTDYAYCLREAADDLEAK